MLTAIIFACIFAVWLLAANVAKRSVHRRLLVAADRSLGDVAVQLATQLDIIALVREDLAYATWVSSTVAVAALRMHLVGQGWSTLFFIAGSCGIGLVLARSSYEQGFGPRYTAAGANAAS